MTIYWLLFAMWSAGTVHFSRRSTLSIIPFAVLAVLTMLMIGLRYRVGGDWSNYLTIYDQIAFQPLSEAIRLSDPGYAMMNWISAQFDLGMWPINLACGALFMAGTARLAFRQPNPWLAMLVAFPYLVIVVAMGYTRQAAAIGIICYALAEASEDHLFRLVGYVILASLIHKTSVLILPMLLVPVFRRNFLFGFLGALLFVPIFIFTLSASAGDMLTSYVQGDYDSQGALVRVSMNVLAAIVMLLTYKQAKFTPFQQSFWIVASFSSLLCLVLLFVLSASSGVDRIALFLIPLQMVAFSRLPYALSRTGTPLPSATIGVIAYCFMVQFVWLNYADNAVSWVPYDSYLTADDI